MICIAVVGSANWLDVSIVPLQSSGGPRTAARMGELAATSRVCQTFVAAHDGLARVEVRLTGRNRKASGPFHFYLRTVPDADHDLVSLTHDAAAVNSNVYHVFRFRPMPGSAGQSYRFCLEAPEADLDSSIAAATTEPDGSEDASLPTRPPSTWPTSATVTRRPTSRLPQPSSTDLPAAR